MELRGFFIFSGVVNSGLHYSSLVGVNVGDRRSCCHGIRSISRMWDMSDYTCMASGDCPFSGNFFDFILKDFL